MAQDVTRPLLKAFGDLALNAAEVATDNAINERRDSRVTTALNAASAIAESLDGIRRDELAGGLDITDGQLLSDVDLGALTVPGTIDHTLGRVPVGAIIVKSDSDNRYCQGVTATTVVMNAASGTVTVWIF